MATVKIKDLWFRATDENMLERDRRVEDTPHYASAMNWYVGRRQLKDYGAWQLMRGKDIAIKNAKYKKLLISAKKKGIRNPIRLDGNYIVDGHHRVAVALALGDKEIECL